MHCRDLKFVSVSPLKIVVITRKKVKKTSLVKENRHSLLIFIRSFLFFIRTTDTFFTILLFYIRDEQ